MELDTLHLNKYDEFGLQLDIDKAGVGQLVIKVKFAYKRLVRNEDGCLVGCSAV
jgi:hypothetical protein